jgi:hypothetical protein
MSTYIKCVLTLQAEHTTVWLTYILFCIHVIHIQLTVTCRLISHITTFSAMNNACNTTPADAGTGDDTVIYAHKYVESDRHRLTQITAEAMGGRVSSDVCNGLRAMKVCLSLHMYVNISECVCVCVCVYIYIYLHTHIHTHTHAYV